MKKLLLSLVALMAIGAYAQDIKFAMDVVEVRQGASVAVPINIENTIDCYAWEAVIGVQGVNVLNGDVKFSNYEKGDRVQNIAYTKITLDEETGEEIGREDRTDGAFDIPYEPQKQEDGTYAWKITGYNTGGFAMKGNSGAVAYITFTVPETVAIDTEFTGYIKGIHFGKEDGSDLDQEDITFTIKVVENVITLDENSTELPEIAENQTVLVKRTINANEWGTICLPFDMTGEQLTAAFGSDVVLAEFDSYEVDNGDSSPSKAVNTEASSLRTIFYQIDNSEGIAANTPYLIKTSQNVSEFTVEGVTVSPEEEIAVEFNNGKTGSRKETYGYFYGTMTAGTKIPANGFFLSGGNFWYSTGNTEIKAFRGYFFFNDILADIASSGVKMEVCIDGRTTRISDLNIVDSEGAIYTIDGKKMNNDVTRLPKGVYLINGKKVAVK